MMLVAAHMKRKAIIAVNVCNVALRTYLHAP